MPVQLSNKGAIAVNINELVADNILIADNALMMYFPLNSVSIVHVLFSLITPNSLLRRSLFHCVPLKKGKESMSICIVVHIICYV